MNWKRMEPSLMEWEAIQRDGLLEKEVEYCGLETNGV